MIGSLPQKLLRETVSLLLGGADRLVGVVRDVDGQGDRFHRMPLRNLEAELDLDRHGLGAGRIGLRHFHVSEAETVEFHAGLPIPRGTRISLCAASWKPGRRCCAIGRPEQASCWWHEKAGKKSHK